MYCLGCSYELAAIESDRCPECGRPFSPDDKDSYGTHRHTREKERWLRQAEIVLVANGFLPVLANILVHLALVLGWFSLGHWPQRSGDENFPDVTGVQTLAMIALLLEVVSYPAILAGLAMGGVLISWGAWDRALRGTLLAAILWGCGYLLIRWDPVWAWSMTFD